MPCENAARSCSHCWHLFTGPLWMVLRNGEMVEECCLCKEHRVVHREHTRSTRWVGYGSLKQRILAGGCNFPWATA